MIDDIVPLNAWLRGMPLSKHVRRIGPEAAPTFGASMDGFYRTLLTY